jgi:RNA polymerase sigma-B factor
VTRTDAERAEMRAAFVEFRASGDRRLRNRLIEGHRPLAVHLARRFADRGEPLDDLVQVACVGLLHAVERFDPERGVEFASFASVTIEGELKRHFRDTTWAIRVPRRSQELHLRLGRTADELGQKLGRSPTIPELAKELDATEDEVLEALEAGALYRSAPLEHPDRPLDTGKAVSQDDRGFGDTELRIVLDELIAELPAREQTILRLRFVEERTQSEIASVVGVSQMHVSRLLTRTLSQLRDRLSNDEVAAAVLGDT